MQAIDGAELTPLYHLPGPLCDYRQLIRVIILNFELTDETPLEGIIDVFTRLKLNSHSRLPFGLLGDMEFSSKIVAALLFNSISRFNLQYLISSLFPSKSKKCSSDLAIHERNLEAFKLLREALPLESNLFEFFEIVSSVHFVPSDEKMIEDVCRFVKSFDLTTFRFYNDFIGSVLMAVFIAREWKFLNALLDGCNFSLSLPENWNQLLPIPEETLKSLNRFPYGHYRSLIDRNFDQEVALYLSDRYDSNFYFSWTNPSALGKIVFDLAASFEGDFSSLFYESADFPAQAHAHAAGLNYALSNRAISIGDLFAFYNSIPVIVSDRRMPFELHVDRFIEILAFSEEGTVDLFFDRIGTVNYYIFLSSTSKSFVKLIEDDANYALLVKNRLNLRGCFRFNFIEAVKYLSTSSVRRLIRLMGNDHVGCEMTAEQCSRFYQSVQLDTFYLPEMATLADARLAELDFDLLPAVILQFYGLCVDLPEVLECFRLLKIWMLENKRSFDELVPSDLIPEIEMAQLNPYP